MRSRTIPSTRTRSSRCSAAVSTRRPARTSRRRIVPRSRRRSRTPRPRSADPVPGSVGASDHEEGGRNMAVVKPIPEGHNTVSPYLIVDGAARALDFYRKAFGATELFRLEGPGGKIGHAEIRIGDTVIMLADVHPEMDVHDPKHYKGTPVSLHLYTDDVDRLAAQAVAAGATVK